MEKLTNNIIMCLRKQVKELHTKGDNIGLSDRIEYAVVNYIIKLASTNDSLAVVMKKKSNQKDIKDDSTVIKESEINSLTIELTKAHKTLYNDIYKQINKK